MSNQVDKKVVIIVDNSNVFIEGQKFSAKRKGQSTPPGSKDLLAQGSSGRHVENAILVGSRPPSNDQVWEMAKKSGFVVTVHDRNASGSEKAVDTELVAQGTEIICLSPVKMDLAILSGDRDFIPLVKMAQKRSWKVEMWAFKNSFNST